MCLFYGLAQILLQLSPYTFGILKNNTSVLLDYSQVSFLPFIGLVLDTTTIRVSI